MTLNKLENERTERKKTFFGQKRLPFSQFLIYFVLVFANNLIFIVFKYFEIKMGVIGSHGG